VACLSPGRGHGASVQSRRGGALGLDNAEEWPGAERRFPRPRDRYYLALHRLSAELQRAIERELAGRRGLVVVDVGCGNKPYFPWFRPYASRYVGVDAYPGPNVDEVAPAEDLGCLGAETADVVLCTQVLEHAENPSRVVGEIHRVLRPGGLCMLSTHGVFVYHGQPHDYWRWTHEGLQRLFASSAPFARLEVIPTEGIASTIANLADFYLYTLTERYRALRFLRHTLHPVLGVVAPRLDRYLAWTFADNPLTINYLVLARK